MYYINIFKQIFVNSVNMPLKQKISVDYGTQPVMTFGLLDKFGKPFEIPTGATFYIAGDTDYNQDTAHCFFSMNYTISGNIITFNINTYSESFLTKVKNPDTSLVVEIGMTVNDKTTVLLQDEILAQPRVYTEGQPIGGVLLPDVTVTADTMLEGVTAINTALQVVTGNISDAVITTDETNGLTISVSKGYVAVDETRVFNPSTITTDQTNGLTVNVSKGYLSQNESRVFDQSIITTDQTNGLTISVSKGYLAQNETRVFDQSIITTDQTNGLTVNVSKGYLSQNESESFPASTITTDQTNGLTISVSKGYLAQNETRVFDPSVITETETQVTISKGWLNQDKAFQVGGGSSEVQGFIFDNVPRKATTVQIIPETLTADQTNFSSMFNNCQALTSIPAFNTSNGTNFSSMFNNCQALTSIPALDTSNGTDFSYMFNECKKLTTIPALDVSNGTNFTAMFQNCKALTSIPVLDTSNGLNFRYTFTMCPSLTTIPALDVSNGTNFQNMFQNCGALTDFGGLLNAKRAFNLAASTNLTHESLINTLNGLADLTGGYAQTLTLGSTNLAKLTDAEKAIATNKNWALA